MAIKYDGKLTRYSLLLDMRIKVKLDDLNPIFASILVGNDKASKLYTNLKQDAARSIGIKMQVFEFNENALVSQVVRQIENLNRDKKICGIMLQLPLPEKFKKYKTDLINKISKEKDVDGLVEGSYFMPAVVKAALVALNNARSANCFNDDSKIAVIGSEGTVGKALVTSPVTKKMVTGFDLGDDLKELRRFDVVVSATGHPNLIKKSMIKKGAVLIDIGAPKPEFDKSCYERASFYTPVPGGVGPVTVACLIENVVQACKNQKKALQ